MNPQYTKETPHLIDYGLKATPSDNVCQFLLPRSKEPPVFTDAVKESTFYDTLVTTEIYIHSIEDAPKKAAKPLKARFLGEGLGEG